MPKWAVWPKALLVDDWFGDYGIILPNLNYGGNDHPRTGNPELNQPGFNGRINDRGILNTAQIILVPLRCLGRWWDGDNGKAQAWNQRIFNVASPNRGTPKNHGFQHRKWCDVRNFESSNWWIMMNPIPWTSDFVAAFRNAMSLQNPHLNPMWGSLSSKKTGEKLTWATSPQQLRRRCGFAGGDFQSDPVKIILNPYQVFHSHGGTPIAGWFKRGKFY